MDAFCFRDDIPRYSCGPSCQVKANVSDLEAQVNSKKTESDRFASETRRISYVIVQLPLIPDLKPR